MRVQTDGATLCVETFGRADAPAVLLVHGAGASMHRWEEPFCERLAAAGRCVVRYDHRDTGASTAFPPGAPGYTGDDLVADPVAILDALGIERAHVVGISMGGALVQRIAVEHPARVLTVTLLCTTSAGVGGPSLPPMSSALRASFSNPPPEPDWADREATIAYLLEAERPYAGRRGVDEAGLRALLGRVYDRSASLASASNHYLVDGTDMPHSRLGDIGVPALVVHGTDDPLFPLPHGESLARAIPGARLLVLEGLGHELPRWVWDEVLGAIVELTA